jgi:hypothetical protein
MNLYDATVPVFTHKLHALLGWLDKAVAYADQNKFDPEVLLVARLAPDQFALLRQIQVACDNIKAIVARLGGKELPSHPDTEKTVPELRERVQKVLDFLGTFKPDDFVGAEDRTVSAPQWQGKTMRGGDYLDHYALPNLYFHLSHAYAILRHNGVPLGKRDFLGDVPLKG